MRGASSDRTAGRRPRCREYAHDVHRGLYRVLDSNRTERCRVLGIASDGDVKAFCICPHPHVGRNRVEVKRTATIKSNGNFRTDLGRERGCCNRATQLHGRDARVQHFMRIEPGERSVQDRRSFEKCHIGSDDCSC